MPVSVGTVLAIIFGVLATIAAYIFIMPAKKRKKLPSVLKALHDIFTFKSLLIEKIVRFLYVFSTIFVEFYGFFLLFCVQRSDFLGSNKWMGGKGVLIMLLGPIVLRIVYEFLMMTVLLVNNIIAIKKKLYNEADDIPAKSEVGRRFTKMVANVAQKMADQGQEPGGE